jgi:hypothetical protein
MNTPFYGLCAKDSDVISIFGSPPRIYEFGRHTEVGLRIYPYATYQTITGGPKNYLSGRPDADRSTIQIDVWGDASSGGEPIINAAKTICKAIELACYITTWRNSIDTETGSYRVSLDADWIVNR